MKGQFSGVVSKVENNHLIMDIDLNGYLGDSSTGLSEMIATSSGRVELPHTVTINGKKDKAIACVNLNVYRVIDESLLNITTIKNKKGKEITVGERKVPRGQAVQGNATQGNAEQSKVDEAIALLLTSDEGKARLAKALQKRA